MEHQLLQRHSAQSQRAPTWLIPGNVAHTAELVGRDGRAADGGSADPDVVQRWLDNGIAPNGEAGRALTKSSVHGFDLTFAARKSVSVLRALTDDVGKSHAGRTRRGDGLSARARRLHLSA